MSKTASVSCSENRSRQTHGQGNGAMPCVRSPARGDGRIRNRVPARSLPTRGSATPPCPPVEHPVDARKNVLAQKGEQPGAEMLVGVETLSSQQQGRDVVPLVGVQFDVFDVNLAGFHLRIAYLSQVCLARTCANRPELGPNRLKTAFQSRSLRREDHDLSHRINKLMCLRASTSLIRAPAARAGSGSA